MNHFQRKRVLLFLLFLWLLFVSPMLSGASPDGGFGGTYPSFDQKTPKGVGGEYAGGVLAQARERDLGDISPDASNLSGAVRLAQTLPFQAPATPEIEPTVSAKTPTQGRGRKVEVSGSGQKQEGTVSKGSAQPAGDRPLGRPSPSTTTGSKKKSAGSDQKASSIGKPLSGKSAEQPQGLEPVIPPSSSVGSSSMPPLPPAMPYTPPSRAYGSSQGGPPIAGETLPQVSRPALAKPKPLDGGLPSATPVGPGGSLDNFVLDSFKGGASQEEVAGGQRAEQKTPPASLFGQLSQDMKQLGEGIRETFRSILSLR